MQLQKQLQTKCYHGNDSWLNASVETASGDEVHKRSETESVDFDTRVKTQEVI